MKKINLEEIENQIAAYHQIKFSSDEADFEHNKALKLHLQDYIMASKNDNDAIQKALLILAKSTGCSDDQIIADEIIDFLLNIQFINQNQCDYFYKNCSTARWN